MTTEARIVRGIVFTPIGRDAAVGEALLREAGINSVSCGSLDVFQALLSNSAAFAVVTEEAMASADVRPVAAWVAGQPSWSDLPFIVLTRHGGGPERNPSAARLSDILGNVMFLERPFHPTTFVSIARTALKGRQRQFDARSRMEELHEGEQRLQTALLAGHLGAWELDLDSWTLIASDTCKAVFGRNPDEPFAYVDMLSSVYPDDRARMQIATQTAVHTAADLAIEYRNLWPDGGVHWVELRARVVRGRTGRHLRLVGVCSDITRRKEDEASQRHLNETLEQRVAQRTAELEQAHRAVIEEIGNREQAEAQLRQVQKMELIGQLTGGVAHDFNNLLMAILANLDLLSKTVPASSRDGRLIEGALQGARRGAALTQRLLAFARRQDLKVEPVDLAALVRGMADLLQRSIGPTIALRLAVASHLPPAMADANQLEMALLNLALNAKDAMLEGGTLAIALDSARMAAKGGAGAGAARYLRLMVTDSGHGMDSETLARAVDPFFTTKGVGKGTGLGLSTVHGLADQLGGELRLTSTPGEGTRAELWLPIAVDAGRAAQRRPALPEPAVPPIQRATILLVDDDQLIAMSTAGMLEDLGHEVIETHSGAEAVAALRDGQRVDLMITDFAMPGMTGAQLALVARRLRPDLPILLASGYAELPAGEPMSLPRLGKPYRQSQLAAEIAKLLAPQPASPRA